MALLRNPSRQEINLAFKAIQARVADAKLAYALSGDASVLADATKELQELNAAKLTMVG